MAAELTKSLLEFSKVPPSNLTNEERLAFRDACQKASLSVENPLEATVRFMFGAYESVALCLGVNMQLLDLGVKAEGPITAADLASPSGADVLLTVRVMRMLVAMGIFKEVGHHTYSANPIANVWTVGSPLREAIIHMASQIPPVVFLPEYFEEKGYHNPDDSDNGPFQYTYQTQMNFFQWLSQRPKIQQAYNTTMRIARNQRGEEWFEYYPVEEKLLLPGYDESNILLVDVGGNVGHDLVNFKKRYPDQRGRLIVEDTPAIVDSATDLPPGIEKVGHDFFKPQPRALQNAKAYYLRNVLHDWPDKNAKIILENVRELMTAESILLVDEYAIPEDNVALYQAELDFTMMGIHTSLDRTPSQFEELLNSAGFKIIGIYRPRDYVPGSGTLFEAVVLEK